MSTESSDTFQKADGLKVIDSLATSIVVFNERFQIRYLNTAAEQLLQISHDRACSKSIEQIFPGDEELASALRQVLVGGAPLVKREMPLKNAAGRQLIVDCRFSLMTSEPRLSLLAEILDAEPRLRINRETALLAQQSVSRQLTRQLAHEVKNPLGGLRGAAQLLQRQLDSEELREYTEVIINEADRLSDLVDSLLRPYQPIEKQSVNIHQLLDQVHKLLASECGGSINIIADYDPSLPECQLDANLITQAFLNIGRNAIQLLQSGGTLRLRTRAETQYLLRGQQHGVVARIDFEDNGPGVAEEVRETLFYPLITARPGGTGLGLALAQELINRHDGLIQLRQPGGPTIFSVYLPG